jgi:hypothetical protein
VLPLDGGRGGGGATRGSAAIDQLAPLATYTVTLTVGGQTLRQKATIARTQGWALSGHAEIMR